MECHLKAALVLISELFNCHCYENEKPLKNSSLHVSRRVCLLPLRKCRSVRADSVVTATSVTIKSNGNKSFLLCFEKLASYLLYMLVFRSRQVHMTRTSSPLHVIISARVCMYVCVFVCASKCWESSQSSHQVKERNKDYRKQGTTGCTNYSMASGLNKSL